jgi:hypothetical protein
MHPSFLRRRRIAAVPEAIVDRRTTLYNRCDSTILTGQINVDDMLVVGSNIDEIKNMKTQLSKEDLGPTKKIIDM